MNLASTLRSPTRTLQDYVSLYGDLVFDLCSSILRNPTRAHSAFRSILKTLVRQDRILLRQYKKGYSTYERGWVLRVTCNQLIRLTLRSGTPIHSPTSTQQNSPFQLQTDFEACFTRLSPEDQLLLLLKDKFQIPDQEISVAMNIPEGSLKIRRQQALRTLNEWMFT